MHPSMSNGCRWNVPVTLIQQSVFPPVTSIFEDLICTNMTNRKYFDICKRESGLEAVQLKKAGKWRTANAQPSVTEITHREHEHDF